MVSAGKLKAVDFYRKIPRDLTEASLSGAGLSILAALCMLFLFGMELSNYLAINTSTSVIVDRSTDGDFLRIHLNISFPALSCEFASVDVSDVLGTNRLNITKTIRKFPIDPHLRTTGSEFHSGHDTKDIKHGGDTDEDFGEGSFALSSNNFDHYSHEYSILVVNFYAPWCFYSNKLAPAWEKAAKTIRERYDPEMDGRILIGKVDCTQEMGLCNRNHIQGYPSIRIFRKGSDVREDHGHHEHESYYGDRDPESLVAMMETLVAQIKSESKTLALENKSGNVSDVKKPAPVTGGCRIEGFLRIKKVPGNLIISARSASHSFDSAKMNMSHVVSHLSFGNLINAKLLTDMKRWSPYVGASHGRLDGKAFITPHDAKENVTIEHYLQVVKTELVSKRGSKEELLLEEYEYTAHSSVAQSLHIPVAKFHMELSPMQVLIEEKPRSFSHFITNLCAIIGGVFTVAGILDSILHNTARIMKKKVDLGKNF